MKFFKPISILIILGLVLALCTSGCSSNSTSNETSIATLQQTVTDQANKIATLQQQIQAISLVPYHAYVTEVTSAHITIETFGNGTYPVIVTLYGSGLKSDGVKTSTSVKYLIVAEYLSATKTELVEVIKPIPSWNNTNTIELIFPDAGFIKYATVSIGIG